MESVAHVTSGEGRKWFYLVSELMNFLRFNGCLRQISRELEKESEVEDCVTAGHFLKSSLITGKLPLFEATLVYS